MSRFMNMLVVILGLICLAFVVIDLFYIAKFTRAAVSVHNFEKAIPYFIRYYQFAKSENRL